MLWRPALRPRRFKSPWETASSPPPPTYAHTILLGGKIISERQLKGAAGVREAGGEKIIRRRALVGQKCEKKSHSPENCRTVPKTPYSIS